MKADIIIPVYKPGKELLVMLERLKNQTVKVGNIILMNTEEKYFAQVADSELIRGADSGVRVYHLSKEEFNHGATRHAGVCHSDAEIFIMLTQDAMPVDEFLVERLTANLTGDVAVAYGRQLADDKSSVFERISREFNYPETSRIKSLEDLSELGIKTYFCSNVCAAYRRDIYDKLGGFVERTIFNEDMLYAAKAVKAGYRISYEAEAKVVHSHSFTNMQQLHRNFDLGVSQAENPQVFAGVKSESEGKKLVKSAWHYLKETGQRRRFPGFCVQCGFKYAGYLLGKKYRKLPKKWVLKLTSNKEYWLN